MPTELQNFSEMSERFRNIVERIVWCTVATVDRQGRPRSRILHPIWQGETGWIATGRQSLKAKHIAGNPNISLTYWDPQHEQAIIDCNASWQDDQESRTTLWNLLKETPEPVGYDPALFWPQGPTDEGFGALKLTPWRMEVWSLADMSQGKQAQVYRPG